MSEGEPGARSIWRNRDIQLAVPARAISTAGDSMAMVALLLHIREQGGGPLSMGLLMVCFTVPTVLLMGVAGRIVDRRDSRQILFAANAVQIIACLGLMFAPHLSVICLLVVLLQMGQAFSAPTWQALVPRIVGDDSVGAAVSWQQGLNSAFGPLGAAAAGFIYYEVGSSRLFLIDAMTFGVLFIAGQLVRTRRIGQPEATPTPRRFYQGMGEGIGILRRSDFVTWSLFLLMCPLIIVMEGVNLNEIFLVMDEMHASSRLYALTEIFTEAGAIFGAMYAARVVLDRSRTRGNFVYSGLSAVIIIAMGFAAHYWIYALLGVLIGFANAAGASMYFTMLATRTPEEHRGKIMAGVNGVFRGVSLLAIGIGATVGRAVGPREVFWTAGTLGLCVVIAASIWFYPQARRNHAWDDKPDEDLVPAG